MWNSEQVDPLGSLDSDSEQPNRTAESNVVSLHPSNESATISKGIVIKGDITGSDSLVIEGRAEGKIHLDNSRVTVGRGGYAAHIVAREVVVMGTVRGNITATDRVEIRAEGTVTGDLSAPRVSIEEGAFFKGGIEIRQPVIKAVSPALPARAEAKVVAS